MIGLDGYLFVLKKLCISVLLRGKKNGSGLLKNCGFVLERLTVLSISCLLGVTSDDL